MAAARDVDRARRRERDGTTRPRRATRGAPFDAKTRYSIKKRPITKR